MHAASGLFVSWSVELLVFAIRQFAPKIMDLSVSASLTFFVLVFLASERSGRRKPPAERSALHIIIRFRLFQASTAAWCWCLSIAWDQLTWYGEQIASCYAVGSESWLASQVGRAGVGWLGGRWLRSAWSSDCAVAVA